MLYDCTLMEKKNEKKKKNFIYICWHCFLHKDCLLYKEVGLVLVSRNSAAITFTSSLL